MGGGVDDKNQAQPSVHLFVPFTNSWVKLPSGYMPVEKVYTANISLSNNRVMVMGGKDDRKGHLHLLHWLCCYLSVCLWDLYEQ